MDKAGCGLNKCPGCGAETLEGAGFCGYCGLKLGELGSYGVQEASVQPSYPQQYSQSTRQGDIEPESQHYSYQAATYPAYAYPQKSGKAIASFVAGIISLACTALISFVVLLMILGLQMNTSDRGFAGLLAHICVFPFSLTMMAQIAALITGIQARKEIMMNKASMQSNSYASVGMFLGALGIAVLIVFWIVALAAWNA